jgi:hypothetical protein
MPRIYRKWGPILEHAAEIVNSYETDVTLRQLFYRLVSDEILRNTKSDYTALASRTAALRRDRAFPAMVDRTRALERMQSWNSVEEAVNERVNEFRLDHSEGQRCSIYVFVEKAALENQLWSWFGHLGIGIAALRGYHSVPLEWQIKRDLVNRRNGFERRIALYVGDYDSTGKDIERNFWRYLRPFFHEVERVALAWDQIEEHDLPLQLGKSGDTRAVAFAAEHEGENVQVEVDALPPDVLRGLLTKAIDKHYDYGAYEAVLEREGELREQALEKFA